MKNPYLLLKKTTQTISFVWLKECARIHQQGKDAHLQPQKKPRYHIAGCNGWIQVTENGSFGGFTVPQQQQCLLLVCYSRQTKNWSAFNGFSCLCAFVWHSTTDRSGGWDSNATTRSSGIALDLPYLALRSKVLRQQPWDHRLSLDPLEELASPGAAHVLHELNQSI